MLSQEVLDKINLKDVVYCSLQTGDVSLSQFINIMQASSKKEVIDIINLVI